MKLAALVLLLLTHACLLTGSLTSSRLHQSGFDVTKTSAQTSTLILKSNNTYKNGSVGNDQKAKNRRAQEASSKADQTEPKNAKTENRDKSSLFPLWKKTTTTTATPGRREVEKDVYVQRFRIDPEDMKDSKSQSYSVSTKKCDPFLQVVEFIRFINIDTRIDSVTIDNVDVSKQPIEIKENILLKTIMKRTMNYLKSEKPRDHRRSRRAASTSSSNTSKFVGLVVGASRNGKLSASVKKLLTTLYDHVWKSQSEVTQQFQKAKAGDKDGKGKADLKYGSILGAFPSYVKENFHGCSKGAALRDKDVDVPDYNCLSTLLILHCLVETVAYGPAITPDHAKLAKAVEALGEFHTHNLDKGNAIMTVWPERLTNGKWVVYPENLVMAKSKGGNTLDKMKALVKEDKTCSAAKQGLDTIMASKICKDHYNTSLAERVYDPSTPPDLMTSFSNLALGALFRAQFLDGQKKQNVFENELEVWEQTNKNFSELIFKLKEMAVVFKPIEPPPPSTTPATISTTASTTSKNATNKGNKTTPTPINNNSSSSSNSRSAQAKQDTSGKTGSTPTQKKQEKSNNLSVIEPKKASVQTKASTGTEVTNVTARSDQTQKTKTDAAQQVIESPIVQVRTIRDVSSQEQKNGTENINEVKSTSNKNHRSTTETPRLQNINGTSVDKSNSTKITNAESKTEVKDVEENKPNNKSNVADKTNNQKYILDGPNHNNQILDSVTFYGIRSYLVQARTSTIVVPFSISDTPTGHETGHGDLQHNGLYSRRYNTVDLTTIATTLHALVVSSATMLVDMEHDSQLQTIVKSSMQVLTWYISNEKELLQSIALSRFPSVYQLYWLVARVSFQLESRQISQSGMFKFAKDETTSFIKSLREHMTFDILKNIKDAGLGSDGKTRVYVDDFIGVKDLDDTGKAKVSGSDRVFTSAMAVNALMTTWTSQQGDGTLKFIKGTKDSVRIAVNSLINYVSSAVLSDDTPLDNALMADTVKNCDMLPAIYPSNIVTNRSGTEVTFEPSNKLRIGVKGYILNKEYKSMLDKPKLKKIKPNFSDVKNMNRDDAVFNFWTSPAYTKAAALLAVAQAANLAIGDNIQ